MTPSLSVGAYAFTFTTTGSDSPSTTCTSIYESVGARFSTFTYFVVLWVVPFDWLFTVNWIGKHPNSSNFCVNVEFEKYLFVPNFQVKSSPFDWPVTSILSVASNVTASALFTIYASWP